MKACMEVKSLLEHMFKAFFELLIILQLKLEIIQPEPEMILQREPEIILQLEPEMAVDWARVRVLLLWLEI